MVMMDTPLLLWTGLRLLFQQKTLGHLNIIQINLWSRQYLMQTLSQTGTTGVMSGEPPHAQWIQDAYLHEKGLKHITPPYR